MRKTTKVIISVILVAVLLLGIGYAAIQNITLNIKGTASADPSQSNFKVMFSGTPTVSDEAKVTAAVSDEINATINVEGLTTIGETVTATYTVQNTSTDLSADLSVATTNSNTEYFTLKSVIAKTSLVPGEATTLTVTVKLTKLPVSEKVSSTIGVQLTAMPVQPGEEGTSEGINGSSSTPESTLGEVTNANIGDYIDLGNSVIGTEATTDDWRILYVEGETVYAILADYLPNSTGHAAATGLNTSGTYSAYEYEGGEVVALKDGLTHATAWDSLANGWSEEVTGAATPTLIANSYNTKNGTNWRYYYYESMDSSLADYDLYVPRGGGSIGEEAAYAYWLAEQSGSTQTWCLNNGGTPAHRDNVADRCGVRPVVALSAELRAELVGDVWTITGTALSE